MVGCALRAGKPAKHRRLELGTATMVRRLRRLANTCSRRWVGAEPLCASVQACIRALVHAAARGVAVARAIGHDSRPDYVAAPTADDPAARSPQRREAPPNADVRSQPLVPARIRPAGEQSPAPSPRTCPVCLEVPTGDNSVLLCAPPRRRCPFPFGTALHCTALLRGYHRLARGLSTVFVFCRWLRPRHSGLVRSMLRELANAGAGSMRFALDRRD